MLIARREDKLRHVADNCIKLGAMDVRAIRADVSKEDDCRRFIEDTVNQYGRCKSFSLMCFWILYLFV